LYCICIMNLDYGILAFGVMSPLDSRDRTGTASS